MNSTSRESHSDSIPLSTGGTETCLATTNLEPRSQASTPSSMISACSMKSGGKAGRIYHVMRATIDVVFSLLTSGFVLSLSLFFP